jgi:hypothetical protein
MTDTQKNILLVLGLPLIMLLLGLFLAMNPPEPPKGVCDGDGTPQECIDWWQDTMERP